MRRSLALISTLLIVMVVGACHRSAAPSRVTAAPPRSPSTARNHLPCSERNEAAIRRSIEGITPASFGADIAALTANGPRVGGDSLARANAYVAQAFEQSGGLIVTRQAVVRDGAPPQTPRDGLRRSASLHAVDGGVHENVIAEAGDSSSPKANPIIIATAHIDTVDGSPGADDNASGVATLLAIGRAINAYQRDATKAKAPTTKTTVRLIAFALEEHGFIGSYHYAKSLPKRDVSRIRAVYNFDMVSFARMSEGSQAWPEGSDVLASLRGRPLRTRGDFIGAVTLTPVDPAIQDNPLTPLREARAYVPNLVVEDAELPRVLLRFAPDFERGDHVAFWELGVPAVDIGDTAELRNPNYHAPSDTMDTLDLAFGAKVARWAAAAILIAREESCGFSQHNTRADIPFH